MSYRLYNDNNLSVMESLRGNGEKFHLIYADMIYEDLNFEPWVIACNQLLLEDGIFIVQTDYHSVAEMKEFLDYEFGRDNFVNWLIMINDWGGTPRKGFPQKHDDILVYSKGKDWYWNKDAIQIPKITAGTAFDKKGTGMKTPCSVFYDHASFSTMSKERVKTDDGHNIRWQKPLWLAERLILPFTKENDSVLDIFMGSGTFGECCIKHNRNYVGIEIDTEVFNLAEERLENG